MEHATKGRPRSFDENQAIEDYARTLRELGEPDEESSTKAHKSLVYTDDTHSRSPLMTLLLALVILAVLSLCVWAGLHFYQRSLAPKTRPATGQRFPPGRLSTEPLIRVARIQLTKEGEHEFTV